MPRTKKRASGQGSIYHDKKRGIWIARYTTGYDDQGKQKRKSISAKTQTLLLDKMRDYERDVGLLSQDADGVTFADWMHKFIYKIKKADLKNRSYQRYDSIYRNYLQDAPFADYKLKEISMTDLKAYYNDLQEIHGKSVQTVKFINLIIRAGLADAVSDRLILSNPTDKITFKAAYTKQEIKAMTKEEQSLAIERLKEEAAPYSLRQMILLALGSGLRLGEISALRWSDIDLKAGSISVSRSIEKIKLPDGSYRQQETTPKNPTSIRDVPLPAATVQMLKEMHKDASDPHDLLFVRSDGRYIFDKTPNRQVQRLCRELDINVITFHNLRHTYATRLFERGVPIKTVQELLGHADMDTTQNIYIHVMPSAKTDAVKLIDDLF